MDINIKELRIKESQLLGFFKERGYTKCYIRLYKTVFNKVFKLVGSGECHTYEDIYRYYLANRSGASLRSAKNLLSSIKYFDSYGTYPEGKIKQQVGKKQTAYELLPDEFREVINSHIRTATEKGKKEGTVRIESISGITFLTCIWNQGIGSLSAITQNSVINVFLGEDGKLEKSSSYKKNIKAIFTACKGNKAFDSVVISRIIAFLPQLRDSRKNIQYLTEVEYNRLENGLISASSPISLRDKAIGLLAMFTGLRSCDIMALTLTSIDWDNDTISIKQQKTGVPLLLPLVPVVGNAIYDYFTKKRLKTDTQEIFISHNHPYERLKSQTGFAISCSIMKKCGIRQEPGDRKGLHLLRHHLATELLANDVPIPTISTILGHSSPDSTQKYLNADFVHLKECSLSIQDFPIKVEVLK